MVHMGKPTGEDFPEAAVPTEQAGRFEASARGLRIVLFFLFVGSKSTVPSEDRAVPPPEAEPQDGCEPCTPTENLAPQKNNRQ